ncbi:hypothetical protein KBD33_05440 [Candidatus Gracilibacteria bacterium]|nr:hypothetical protein [Candidatus Gracilibacteria bacterium]
MHDKLPTGAGNKTSPEGTNFQGFPELAKVVSNLVNANNVPETNVSKYLQKYDELLRTMYGDKFSEMISKMEEVLRGLPITHSTHIDKLDSILVEGLKSYKGRGTNSYAGSGIFKFDHQYGLDRFVFAKIGVCPPYGEEAGRVTILMDDGVLDMDGFFTFYDLTGFLLASERRDIYQPDPYADRIRKQYPESKLSNRAIYQILARTFLVNRKGLDDFFKIDFDGFPPALDPDFEHTNGGSPEIKLPQVSPKHFIGFAVGNNEIKEQLMQKGIPSNKILVIKKGMNVKKILYEFNTHKQGNV